MNEVQKANRMPDAQRPGLLLKRGQSGAEVSRRPVN